MPDLVPRLPPGYLADAPGRGRLWVWETPGPPGAPTLLLLHGWTSTAALNWFRCFEPLSQEFRVIAPDHRGHGRGIRSRRPFRLEDCADDVAALIEALGTGPVIAVGYSMGGLIAQLLWRRHRSSVQGLVLCATASRFTRRTQMAGPLSVLSFGASLALTGLPASARRQGFSRLVRTRSGGGQFAQWIQREWEGNDPAALLQAGVASTYFDSRGWAHRVDVPTAVVVTTQDATATPAVQYELAGLIPGAQVFNVAGGHRACVETPEFVPVLLAACRAVHASVPLALGPTRS